MPRLGDVQTCKESRFHGLDKPHRMNLFVIHLTTTITTTITITNTTTITITTTIDTTTSYSWETWRSF